MSEEEEAFIQGIEFARDWNSVMPEEDYERYLELIAKRAEEETVQAKMDELRKALAEAAAGFREGIEIMCKSMNKFLTNESVMQIVRILCEMQREQEERNKEE